MKFGIRSYLAGLSPLGQAAVMTKHMEPGTYFDNSSGRGCLVGVGAGFGAPLYNYAVFGMGIPMIARQYDSGRDIAVRSGIEPDNYKNDTVELRYDAACMKYGTGKINAMIRNYLLKLQIRRGQQPMELIESGRPLAPTQAQLNAQRAYEVAYEFAHPMIVTGYEHTPINWVHDEAIL